MYLSTSDMCLCWEDTNFRFHLLGRAGWELWTGSFYRQCSVADYQGRCRPLSLKWKAQWVSRCSKQNDLDCACKWGLNLVRGWRGQQIHTRYLSKAVQLQLPTSVHAQVLFLDCIMELLCGTCFCNGNHIYKCLAVVLCYWYQNAQKKVLLSIVFALYGRTFGILLHIQENFITRCLSWVAGVWNSVCICTSIVKRCLFK